MHQDVRNIFQNMISSCMKLHERELQTITVFKPLVEHVDIKSLYFVEFQDDSGCSQYISKYDFKLYVAALVRTANDNCV